MRKRLSPTHSLTRPVRFRSFYPQAQQSQPIFVIVDPVNPGNNTARNSHRTPDILQKFNEAFSHLKGLIHGEFHRLTALRSEAQALSPRGAAQAGQLLDSAAKGTEMSFSSPKASLGASASAAATVSAGAVQEQ